MIEPEMTNAAAGPNAQHDRASVGDTETHVSRAPSLMGEGEHSGSFTCALAMADDEGNTTSTSPVSVPRELLGIVVARLLPVAIDCGFALEVSR